MSVWMYFNHDPQDMAPKGYCRNCMAELYQYDDDDYCPRCLEELNERDFD